jgi:phenylacetate-coenzyme A ligase PaaK-like adenylate-forming protein
MISPVNKWIAERTGLLADLNVETLRQWQQKKLEALIVYARRNSRFYQEKLPNTNKLTDLPFTLPAYIADDPLSFLAIPQSEVVRVTTLANSGTTRLKKRIFFSEADLERTIDFFTAGMSTMVCKGDHVQILISNRTENSLGSLLKQSLERIGVASEISGAIKTANAAIEASRKADCLVGMPAEIFYMSRTEQNLRPKSVLLTADHVPQSVIESIKETWKCNVFTHYGHTEFGYGCAVDCGHHNGHHLRDADIICEIINPETGKPVHQGEHGEIVITTLSNEAMPLIRYRTGNISCIFDEPCGCGSLLHRLGRIEGRYESVISVGNGKTITIHQLDELIFRNPVVRGFDALLKNDSGRKTLQLTVDSLGSVDLDFITKKLPSEVNLKVIYGEADPFTHRRKRRLYIE